MKEYIICAAIHYDDGTEYIHQCKNIKTGFVIAGRRHHNCFATIALFGDKKYKSISHIQGFITSTDKFVDRHKAYIIAKSANQLIFGESKHEHPVLISEDIY